MTPNYPVCVSNNDSLGIFSTHGWLNPWMQNPQVWRANGIILCLGDHPGVCNYSLLTAFSRVSRVPSLLFVCLFACYFLSFL